MGFGTLFIGYFFILNISFYGFTDAIAGIVMLYGAYKLSEINKSFKRGTISALVFTVFGIFELGHSAYDIFLATAPSSETLVSIISVVRYLIIALTTVFFMLGMRDVANEVKLRTLSIKCERVFYMTIPIYALSVLLEIFAAFNIFTHQILTVIGIMTLVCNVALTVMVLICIYSCYMRICMPGEEDKQEKESRFAFVNAFRRHEEKKRQEYAEYKLEKYKKAQEKKKRKNK